MSLLNPFANSIATPGVARTASLRVDGGIELSGEQLGDVQNSYTRFKLQTQASVAGYLTRRETLADGTQVQITSNNGVDQVFVKPIARKPQEFQPLWMLVNIIQITRVASGPRLNDELQSITSSYLYSFGGELSAGGATLRLKGRTTVNSPNDTSGEVDANGIGIKHVTTTEQGIGAIQSFLPNAGHVVTFHYGQDTISVTPAGDVFNDIRHGSIHETITSSIRLDGALKATYQSFGNWAFDNNIVFLNERHGERLSSVLMQLAKSQANFTITTQSGKYDGPVQTMTFTPRSMKVDFAATDDTHLIVEDPDAIPALSLGTDPSINTPDFPGFEGPVSRREVGLSEQGPKYIYMKGAKHVRDRHYKLVKAITQASPVIYFMDDYLFGQAKDTAPNEMQLAAFDYFGNQLNVIRLKELPELSDDPLFDVAVAAITSFGSKNTAWTGRGEGPSAFIYSDGDRTSPLDFSTTTATLKNGPVDTSIEVTLVTDQSRFPWSE